MNKIVKIHKENKYVVLDGEYNPSDGSTIIYRGSQYRSETTASFNNFKHMVRFRNEVLREIGNNGKTSRNYKFNSASAAASVMCGAMTNGLDFFELEDGKTINQAFFNKKRKSKNSEIEDDIDIPQPVNNKRLYSVGKKALSRAQYTCFIDPNHDTFLTDSGDKYMEAHHLIPYKEQSRFKYSLQVPANIVCLCPQCHRELHYGKNRNEILKKLYKDRIDSLRKCGIDISFDELLKFYKLKRK